MELTKPHEWREDPWIVANKTLAPCYIGGWSACEHWGLTEQIFREIVVFTSRRLRRHLIRVQEAAFRIKRISREKIFGTKVVWRKQVRVSVSDPSRTLVDILDDPRLGGGMKHVAAIVAAYFRGELRDDRLLMEYAAKLDNRTIYKRLGYLIETLNLDAKAVLDACRTRISSGITYLDPGVGKRGRIVRRWNLLLNVDIKQGEGRA